MRVDAPRSANLPELAGFCLALRDAAEAEAVEVDFGNIAFTSPAWLAIVGGAMRRLRQDAPSAKRRALNYRSMGYAAQMGFFRYFGMSFGLAPAEAAGSDTYVPLTEHATAEVVLDAQRLMRPVGEVIQAEAGRLAAILSKQTPGDLQDTLTYAIREIVRNVVEHSGAETFTLAAQWWPASDRVEVVVTDHGCGLSASLRKNPNLRLEGDEAAIRHAVLPGVSAKAWRKSRGHDDWKNSGYGLFMTQQLCAVGGEFALLSGGAALCVSEQATTVMPACWPGVAVVLRLDTSRLTDLNDRLAQLRREGVVLEREIRGAAKAGPSRASQTLHPGSAKDPK